MASNVSLLSAEAVCERLNCSRVQLWRWSICGRLPRVILGKRFVRYRPEDIERFIVSAMTTAEVAQ
jgi:predicted DNA-binding transcriptional regulator AlpA